MGLVTPLSMLKTEKARQYWQSDGDEDVRGDSLDDYVDLGEKVGAPWACEYCDEPIEAGPEAREHHMEEHPNERYDPIWYVDS